MIYFEKRVEEKKNKIKTPRGGREKTKQRESEREEWEVQERRIKEKKENLTQEETD